MFIIKKKNCRKFSVNEKLSCLDFLKKVTLPINISQIDFFWCDDMNSKNGKLGCFDYKIPDSLFLMPPVDVGIGSKELYNAHIKMIAPTIVHELTHMKQYRELGVVKYVLSAIPFIRETLLEKEARANEEYAEIELENLT